ncbi:MAG: hypothetical protein HOH19_14985 [Kordiimonadaceae bacterium]|jgi:hypothetical protein|nr:hypothetical protein [Kordiimonadaceae bacterium]MBT6033876.1 hypothetical protein [Kordiimonadaceae bacterium]
MAEKNWWNLDKLEQMVECYCLAYRNPKLEPLKISKIYYLENKWNEQWPNADSAGVYAIFGKSGLLYIGKASLKNSIGNRLADYFEQGNDGNNFAKKKHNWSDDPTYFVTIATRLSWEAPALEEFLILQAKPVDNTIGNK